MHDCIEEITVVEQVDGQSETLVKIGADENSEEITRARGKEFGNGTMEPLKNSVNSEVFTSASIQSKEEQKEVFVEDVIKKQHFQDVDLINESKSLPDGTAVEIQGADIHKTLDMHDEVAVKQIHDCGIICENTETQILEDNHIVHSEVNDLVVMEVDEAWSTVRTHNQEAFDLEKETMEARQDLGCTIENIKMAMPGDAIMPGCSEFQTDSPETKISEVVSTKGIMSQEHLSINEKQVLEKGLECKLTEGNARPLVVTNVLGGDGVDTTVVTVDVNKANCIEGIQNQEVCGTEELQARQGKQHTGVGDVRILEDTSTNDSGDAGSEKDLCMEKGLVVLEKQDEETADENTERTLIDRGAPECGEAKHDGTMEMIHETDSAVQDFNMTEDIIPFKNEQKLTVLEKQDEETTGENTERTLVGTCPPECDEVKHDGTMQLIHETDCTVQAVNMAEDKISFKNKQNPDIIPFKNEQKLTVLEKQDEETTGENTERTLVGTCPPECDEVKHDGTMQLIHETDCTVQAVNMEEDKILFKSKKNLAVLEKQDEETTGENTERTLVGTCPPECDEVKHDGTMQLIHETDCTVQAVNMAEDKISFKNKQNPVVLEKQNEGTMEENTGRTLVDTDAPECGEEKHDGTMKTIHGADSTVQAVNMAEDKNSFKNKQNPAVLEKQNEGTTEENTKRTLVDTDAPKCGEGKHDGTMKTIHGTDSTVQAVNMTEDKISFNSKQNPTVLEKQNEGTTEENTKRTLVDTDASECGGAKHDGTMKTNHGTNSPVQAVNTTEKKFSFKIKQKGVPFGDHNKSVAEGSGSNKTARKEFKGALQPDSEHEVEAKQEILEDRAEMSIGRENDEASEQEQTSTEDAIIAPSGMDRGENNNEWAEEPIKSYGKYASNPVNTDCQTSKFGRPSIEEVRRIHSGRSVYLKDIKESQGRIRSEPSNRTPINNAGYNSRHGVPEPVTVVKDIKVPSHDTVSASGRDRALELVTGPPEETPRWRQEQYALNMLEDVQNARIAEKTRMEMEIRILKAQIVSMQKQVMNTDHAGEVISRSKRH
uniref:Uncharacterized protein n=1 Tax=Avena sativa TaxID=4498 RepID=A0ACD5UPC3_AVESA